MNRICIFIIYKFKERRDCCGKETVCFVRKRLIDVTLYSTRICEGFLPVALVR